MPRVSREQIARAKEVNILDYVLRNEPQNFKKSGNRYIMREHDSFVISNGKWVWNSRGFGANTATALNYLIKCHGYSFMDAVLELARDDLYRPIPGKPKSGPSPIPTVKRRPFTLPPRNNNNDRAIEYLLSRGIDRKSIDACIAAGTLYESVKAHNCVFTGINEEGKTRYATYRGTSGQYKRDADNSDKRCCFLLQPLIPENYHKAACFESPIDALSNQSLFIAGHVGFDGWRLTLGGDSAVALEHFLLHHPYVNTCHVCTDNDKAGETAAARIIALIKGDKRFSHVSVERGAPPIGKDWNDTLMEIRKQERKYKNIPEGRGYHNKEARAMIDARKDIIFRDEHYKEIFKIKDGDRIKITVAYDGEELIRKCRFLDEAHMFVGSTCLHMDEFLEKQARAGNKYEPVHTEPKLDILFVVPGQKPRDLEIPIDINALRVLVGGEPAITPLNDHAVIVKGVTGGDANNKDGAFAVCGFNDGELTSLHPYWAQKYKLEFTPRDREEKKPSIKEQLAGAQKSAAELNRNAAGDRPAKNRKKDGMDI